MYTVNIYYRLTHNSAIDLLLVQVNWLIEPNILVQQYFSSTAVMQRAFQEHGWCPRFVATTPLHLHIAIGLAHSKSLQHRPATGVLLL